MEVIKENTKRIEFVNFNIRTKLLLIYVLCVLVPIIVFSSAFYSSVMKSTEKEKLILFNQALGRISSAIESNAISAMELSNIIYPDEMMYEYLNNNYENKMECLEDYNEYLRDVWNKVLPYNTQIGSFSVYTNNDTVLNSTHVQRIDNSIIGSNWYSIYKRSDEKVRFFHHIDQLFASSLETKLVSFIRKLDYISSDKYTHFLKITFQDDMFDKILKTENLPGNTYVVNQDKLIIAQSNKNGDDYSSTEFVSFNTIAMDSKQIVLRVPIQAMDGWEVICVLDKDFMKDEFRMTTIQIFLLMFFVTIFASIIIWTIAASLYTRIDILVEHMGKVEKGEYELISERKKGKDEIGLLITSMNKMIAKIKILIEDVYKAKLKQTQVELLKKQAELNALQCQVNPHFMFNVLETIRIKSYLKNEFETARIIKYMSKIFRKLLLWNEDLIELKEELSFIKEYLEIQQYRYDDELEFEISVEESILGLKIPKMTLQTFVDNACEHGFGDNKELKIVRINIQQIDGKVELRVYDNGKGIAPELLHTLKECNSRGIGIKNVIGRLDVYYKDSYDLKMNSKLGEFTEVTLNLDLKELRRCEYV